MEKLRMNEQKKYDTIKKWCEGKINYKKVELKLRLSERQLYRLKKKYKEKGKEGFIHGNRGRKPKTTINQSLSIDIVHYYLSEYQGFNFNHYRTMLAKEKNINVSYSKIYNELTIKNGILSPRAKKETRKKYKKMQLLKKRENKNKTEKEIEIIASKQVALENATPRIPKSAYFGENIEMDASSYVFFGDIKSHLHLSIDTATNTCVGGYLDYQETLNGYYHVLHQILINYGIPMKFTTDGRTIFEYQSKKMKSDVNAYFTQFKHACNTLGIEITITSKSQKKPRVEKYNETFQDRLSMELHHHNITTIEEANDYLINSFIPEFNDIFARKIKVESVFEKIDDTDSLNYILAVLSIRKFNNGNSISYKGKIYLPYNENNNLVCYRNGTECTVIEAFNKQLYVQIYGEIFILKEFQETLENDETLEDYFDKINSDDSKNTLPKPQNDWDKDKLDEIFEDINKEYNIYDSHNPKI